MPRELTILSSCAPSVESVRSAVERIASASGVGIGLTSERDGQLVVCRTTDGVLLAVVQRPRLVRGRWEIDRLLGRGTPAPDPDLPGASPMPGSAPIPEKADDGGWWWTDAVVPFGVHEHVGSDLIKAIATGYSGSLIEH